MSGVLFTSVRPLERAENLKAVFDVYDGEKAFIQRKDGESIPGIHSGRYTVVVADGLIEESPGKYIWIGHGMGAGKKIGLHHPSCVFKGSKLITYAIASSEEMVPFVASFCGISKSKVVPLGMPRTDAYFKAKQAPHDGKVHLYAPTFRGGFWAPDFNKIWRMLPPGDKFIYKPHMVTKQKLVSFWQGIETASEKEPSTPYLVDADTVITDYSSIMFDAMVLRKPVVLFAKDCDNYLRARGMYCQYPEAYSEYYAEDEAGLMNVLPRAEWSDYLETRREYFCGACDGHSTARTIELIRSVL